MPIPIACKSCGGKFNAPDSAGGKRTSCPKCRGIIEIPAAELPEEILEAEVEPSQAFEDDEFEVEPPHETPESRRPCPKCGEMILVDAMKCRFCGEIFDPALMAYGRTTVRSQGSSGAEPLYLHIPTARLILLSIFSAHLYEAYWIYKNWRYLKQRNNLAIWPFWRGIFGIFFCHSLLRHIYDDEDARAIETPTFSPGWLATGWVLLSIFGNIIDRIPVAGVFVVTALMPSYLCLLPVQKYINSVTVRRNASEPYYRWSWGHVVCIAMGALAWLVAVLEIVSVTMQP